jgi:UDP-N-acetylmuramyl tripeptide synthase
LFEVDEFWLDGLVDQLAPRALLLSNLFRDQLDRYGELETIVQRWQALLDSQPGLQVVLNADDPVIADLGRGRDNVLYFGIEDRSVGTGELDHAADARHCRRCGAPYSYEVVFLAHLGHYACDSCGSARPDPQITVDRVALSGLSGSSFALRLPAWSAEIEIPLPGLYNVYNALAAAALAHALGVSEAATRSGLDRTAAAFGRGESVVVGGQSLLLLLIKNPAGANEVLRTLALEKRPVRLLAMLNDRIADGRDVSWVWDADYETLAGHVSEVVCSGDRAAELAVRLKYAGLHPETLLVEPDPSRALDLLVKRAAGTDDRLVAIPTYTAMLELREVLVARGVAAGSFE